MAICWNTIKFQVKFVEYMLDHLEIVTTSLHKDSHEAHEQLQLDGIAKEGLDLIFQILSEC